jgi:leader peptidase (prepilin peptidase)/N-methyltransferase
MALSVLIFVVGLIIGSFINVCIYRLPKGLSVVFPRSRCPHCERLIRPWENIPILSFVFQKGRCRGCGHPIGWVYPAVEVLTAICFLVLYLKFDLTASFLLNAFFVTLIIALIFIDLFDRILPDLITLGGTVCGVLLAPLQSPEFMSGPGSLSWGGPLLGSYVASVLGVLLGGGFLWLVAMLYLKLRRIEGMGLGDVKMMAMVGAFLGWQFAWLTILVGSFLGAILGGGYIWLRGRGRRYELPFGSFLGIAAIAITLSGPGLLRWYLGFFFGS